MTKFINQYIIKGNPAYDQQSFMIDAKENITNILANNHETSVKLVLECEMEKVDVRTGEKLIKWAVFSSDIEVNLLATNVDDLYKNMLESIMERMANFQWEGSGWRFKSVITLTLHTVVHRPLSGSSSIKLPKVLVDKKAIINLKNNDDECFKWCVTRAINPVEKNAEYISKQVIKELMELDWDGIDFPVSLKKIDNLRNKIRTLL